MLRTFSVIRLSDLFPSLYCKFCLVDSVELGLALLFYSFYSFIWQLLSFNWGVYFICKVIIDMVGCKPSFSTCFLFRLFSSSFLYCSFPSFFWDDRVFFSVPFSPL